MTSLQLCPAAPATTQADAVVVAVAPPADGDSRPVLLSGAGTVDAALGGRLAQLLADLGATGKADDLVRVTTLGATTAPVVVAVGVGSCAEGDPEPEALRRAAAVATRALHGSSTVVLAFPIPTSAHLAAAGEGALLGGYDFTEFRHTSRKGRKPAVATVLVVSELDEATAAGALARGTAVAEGVALVRDLVNTPPGSLPPARLAEVARERGEAAGCSVEVLDEKALAEGGYGGILGVGQGSSRPPRLVKVAWQPAGAVATVALVGKGITFDSGGLSLKPPASMETMKCDMAGAATVLATVVTAATLNSPVAVTAWLACAENMPSGEAIRPSDVLRMYGGTRVEVLNTDAEGRLVLADALVRASEDSPDALVDIATLTGAQVVALGKVAGLMSNDDAFRDRVHEASRLAGESMWPMPLPAPLREKLDSQTADLSNVQAGGVREGGMLVAGLFLQEFVPDGLPWAHLDIAGPSWHDGGASGHESPGGTGFGVRTLLGILDSQAGMQRGS